MNKRRLQSVVIRLVLLAAGLVLIWPLTPWDAGPRVVVETSPLVAICASIINRAIGLTAGIGFAFGEYINKVVHVSGATRCNDRDFQHFRHPLCLWPAVRL